MTNTHRRHNPTEQKFKDADIFDEPTILVNCSVSCSQCKKLYPFIDDDFKAFCKDLGYDVYINKSDVKCGPNWKKYGQPTHFGQGTPQIYAINGEKAAGVKPDMDGMDGVKLRAIVDTLTEEAGR